MLSCVFTNVQFIADLLEGVADDRCNFIPVSIVFLQVFGVFGWRVREDETGLLAYKVCSPVRLLFDYSMFGCSLMVETLLFSVSQ